MSYAQEVRDVFKLEHTYSPSSDDFDYNSTEFKFNLPIKLKKGFLLNSLSFNYNNLSYNKDYIFNTNALENIYNIDYALAYSYPLKKKWMITARINPRISSNLEGNLSGDDVLINGALIATKRWGEPTKGSALTFGLAYATLSGRPGVVPFVSFKQVLNEKMSYAIGFPDTYFQYKLNAKHRFRAGLSVQGFYSNLSGNDNPVINGETATKIQFRNFLANIEYNYVFAKHWKLNASAGYSFSNEYILADDDQNELFDFEIENRPFFTFGVSYDILGLLKKKAKAVQ
jgi:hypothetical protein